MALLPAMVLAAAPGVAGAGTAQGAANSSSTNTPIVSPAVQSDTSPPLRDIKPAAAPTTTHTHDHRNLPVPPSGPTADPVVQNSAPAPATATTSANFLGVGAGFKGPAGTFSVTSAPPDTNGAVGATQFVEIVNQSFAVFDKSTKAVTLGPLATNTLFSGFGGGCQTNDDGDGTVKYDQIANRWIITQFSVSTTPYLQCVAVSATSDATGSWHRYAFAQTSFPDYPKLAVWPDGYYQTFNRFNGNTFVGAEVCAYDRAQMISGGAAAQVCFNLSSTYGGLLPSDLDGSILPPTGSPNYVLNFGTNSLNLWKFHVDFATPTNSTLTGPTTTAVAAFTPACGGGTCIPQSGTRQQLDSLGDRLMYRLAYRRFSDGHESLVVTHSVTAGSSVGVRWYELRNPAGILTVYQQGTFAPDSSYRWMGSAAMDQLGDVAMGYSISSGSMFPGIRYTGRVATDPLGTMEAETTLTSGGGSQLRTLNRWGDYTSMAVDPTDDCTFWYSNEYLQTSGTFNWSTRVGTLRFPGCSPPAAPSGLAAAAVSANQVNLSWVGSAGASGYDVDRSTDGVNFTQVATNVAATSYADTQSLRLPGSGATVSTPSSSTLSVTGDIDIRVKAALDNWAPSVAEVLVAKDGSTRSYDLYVQVDGTLCFMWSPDGTNAAAQFSCSSATTTFANGTTHWVRVTRSASTGVTSFYTSPDGQAWTQLGSALSGPAGSIYASGQALGIGSYGPGAAYFTTGTLYDVEVRAGIGGPVVASPNFATASGASFSDAQTNTWAISGTASLQGGPPLNPATTYTYRVQAISTGGTSTYSPTASATTPSV